MKPILAIILLSVFCAAVPAQDNPFLQMAGKKYADYSREFDLEYQKFIKLDTVEKQKVIRQIEEVAESTGSMEWKIYVDFFKVSHHSDKYKHFHPPNDYSEELLALEFELLKKVQQAGVVQIELKIMREIILGYHILKNHELSLEQCEMLADRLTCISSDEIPEKALYYLQIGNRHISFKNYPKAIFFYKLALNEKVNHISQLPMVGALNNLGLCYNEGYKDYKRADSCFYAILQIKYISPDDEANRENWDGIAEGNIADNLIMQGEYDKAIPFLKSSLEKVMKFDDYGYGTGIHLTLANISLQKGHTAEAKRHIDQAIAYRLIEPRYQLKMYETLSRYYAMTGNAALSIAYLDSTLAEKTRHEEEFNALQMIRVEQRKHISEKALKDEQLQMEKIRNAGFRRSLFIAVTGLLLLGGGFIFYLVLYIKKRTAYRELVRKSQEWAQTTVNYRMLSGLAAEETVTPGKKRTETDRHINKADVELFKQLQHLLQVERIHSESTVTMDSLADRMKVNKTYLSRAINLCSGSNFNTFINEYRIKEAIRFISDDSHGFSLEGIGFEVGFSECKSFYKCV